MKNKRFKTKKLKVSNAVLNKIVSSEIMTDREKVKFMAFV
jgi:hypothetical protein